LDDLPLPDVADAAQIALNKVQIDRFYGCP
jgi:hypothetical protein